MPRGTERRSRRRQRGRASGDQAGGAPVAGHSQTRAAGVWVAEWAGGPRHPLPDLEKGEHEALGAQQGWTVPEGAHQSVRRGHRGITPTRQAHRNDTPLVPAPAPAARLLVCPRGPRTRCPSAAHPELPPAPWGVCLVSASGKFTLPCLGQNLELFLTLLAAPSSFPFMRSPSVCPGKPVHVSWDRGSPLLRSAAYVTASGLGSQGLLAEPSPSALPRAVGAALWSPVWRLPCARPVSPGALPGCVCVQPSVKPLHTRWFAGPCGRLWATCARCRRVPRRSLGDVWGRDGLPSPIAWKLSGSRAGGRGLGRPFCPPQSLDLGKQ